MGRKKKNSPQASVPAQRPGSANKVNQKATVKDGSPKTKKDYQKEARMKAQRKRELKNEELKKLKAIQPSKKDLAALNDAIKDICTYYGIDEGDMKQRQETVDKLQKTLQSTVPDADVQMYGSSLTGFGLKCSNLDIHVTVPKGSYMKQLLDNIEMKLKNEGCKNCERMMVYNSIQGISFKPKACRYKCRLTVGPQYSVLLSKYLALYAKLDKRVRMLAVAFRNWAKVCMLDNPTCVGVTFPSHALALMVIYFLQHTEPPVLPVLWSNSPSKASADTIHMIEKEVAEKNWCSRNNSSIGSLWWKFMRFYHLSFYFDKEIVCVHDTDMYHQHRRKWTKVGIAIEDPFNINTPVLSKQLDRLTEYFLRCMLTSSKYFMGQDSSNSAAKLKLEPSTGLDSPSNQSIDSEETLVHSSVGTVKFMFNKENLAPKALPPKLCPKCMNKGHTSQNCPRNPVVLKKLPSMTSHHLDLLTSVIKGVPDDFTLGSWQLEERERIRKELEVYLQKVCPGWKMCIYGSTKNGFGFSNSDLDLTIVNEDDAEVSAKNLIKKMKQFLSGHHAVGHLIAFPSAKCPIVKFTFAPSGLEVDISVNNILALHNTELLNAYSRIDRRVRMLGYAIKVLAKICKIGDASQGTLSSYTYLVMMLHYLQHTDPPVIPVLQQLKLPGATETGSIMKEGCNVWFFDDLDNLGKVWPGRGRNSQSVGELWLGFFRYYLEEFSRQDQVVTIRQFEKLSKSEKTWKGIVLSVEDPFRLDMDLANKSEKRDFQIRSVFERAREFYGTPINKKDIPSAFPSLADFFFDEYILTGSAPVPKKEKLKGNPKQKQSQKTKKKEGDQATVRAETDSSGNKPH